MFAEQLLDWAMDKDVYPKDVKTPFESIEDNFNRLKDSRLYKETPLDKLVTKERLLSHKKGERIRVYPADSFMSEREFENRLVFTAVSDKIHDHHEEGDKKNQILPVCMVNGIGFGKPLISSIRLHGDKYTILWQTPKDLSAVNYGKQDPICFTDKPICKAVWRGIMTPRDDGLGFSIKMPFNNETFYRPSIGTFVIDRYKSGFVIPPAVKTIRSNLKDQDFFDIALNSYSYYPGTVNPIYSDLDVNVSKVCQKDLFQYKFILCLEDNDNPNLFPFALASNCIPICPYPFIYETLLHFDIKPWVHFIPINRDFGNFKEILFEIEQKKDILPDIALNGKLHSTRIYEKHVRDQFVNSFIKRWL